MILRNTKGFTFIELTIVIVLAGILFSLTLPRFRDTILTDSLKNSTRKLIYKIHEQRNNAIRENEDYGLVFDLESKTYWVEHETMSDQMRANARENASTLPEDVRIVDVWIKGAGKVIDGVVGIWFNRKGYVQQSAIHLRSEDEREFTLVLRPFLRNIEILDKYVEFEDI